MGEINGLPNFQEQLLERRRRLDAPGLAGRDEVRTLIHDVDAARERFEAGEYGLCEECHDPIRP